MRVCGALLAASIFALSGCARPAAGGNPLDTLLGLINQRLALADDVARSKWNSGAAVEDLPRERQIVHAIGDEAPRYGLDPALAMDFFRAQIEASKIAQNARLAQWRAEQRAPFTDAPDLQRDMRPQLDRLTPVLLEALAKSLPILRTREARATLGSASTGAARTTALAPLVKFAGSD